jgi:multidrug efflux pump subunit AcrA (membrane-fusion protein)
MADIIQIRRDTAANWTSANPTLAQGELGLETDTLKIKAGDGSTAWSSLGYLIDTGDYLAASDIGVTLQGYDADTMVTDVAQVMTAELTVAEFKETVYNLTGTQIDPANGSVQYKTLTENTTFTEAITDGQAVTLRIEGGATYTVTWPTMTWIGSGGNVAPTLNGTKDVVVIWQENSTVYGAYVGYGA